MVCCWLFWMSCRKHCGCRFLSLLKFLALELTGLVVHRWRPCLFGHCELLEAGSLEGNSVWARASSWGCRQVVSRISLVEPWIGLSLGHCSLGFVAGASAQAFSGGVQGSWCLFLFQIQLWCPPCLVTLGLQCRFGMLGRIESVACWLGQAPAGCENLNWGQWHSTSQGLVPASMVAWLQYWPTFWCQQLLFSELLPAQAPDLRNNSADYYSWTVSSRVPW